MPDPLKASVGSTGWRKDSAGLMIPMGSSTSAKMLLGLPKEIQDIATSANTMVRGKFTKELWPKLSLLSTLAGPEHLKTRMLIANITAGSMAEGGQASINFLQGIVNMLVPSALPTADGHRQPGHDGNKSRRNHNEKIADDNE